MLSFTIRRSPKTHRCYIYNKDYFELAQCATMNDVFDYFFYWCDQFGKSVIYTQTDDKNVILAKMV